MSQMQQNIKEVLQIQIAIREAMKQDAAQQQQFTNINNSTKFSITPDDLLAMERTKLANERTKLANQRTLLAYIRTSLAFLSAAVTLIQFFENKTFVMIGYFFIFISLLFLFIGLCSYRKSSSSIKKIELVK